MAAKAGSDKDRPAGGASPGAGHNLSEKEQQEALFLTHMEQARRDNAALEAAMVQVRAVRKVRNKNRTAMRGDGFPLEMVDRILEDEAKNNRGELAKEAEKERWMRQLVGLPVGGQLDMFSDKQPVMGQDDVDIESSGYAAGVRGEEPKPPASMHPQYHQRWLKAFHDGQERAAWARSARGEIVDRRTDIKPGPVELDPEPVDDEEGPAEGGEDDDAKPTAGEMAAALADEA